MGGFAGALWDRTRSREENLLREFTTEAVDWFKDRGLPLPPALRRQCEARSQTGLPMAGVCVQVSEPGGEVNTKHNDEDGDPGILNSNIVLGSDGSLNHVTDVQKGSAATLDGEHVVLQDTVVQ